MVNDDRIRVTGGLVLDHTGTQVDFAGGDLSFYGHGFARHREDPPPADLVANRRSSSRARRWPPTASGSCASAASTTTTSPSSRTSTSAGGPGCSATSAGSSPRRSSTTATTAPSTGSASPASGTCSNATRWPRSSRTTATTRSRARCRPRRSSRSCAGSTTRTPRSATTGSTGTRPARRPPTPMISSMTGAHLAAVRDFGLMLEELRHKRAFVQANRRRDDREILRLFRRPIAPNVPDPVFTSVFLQGHRHLQHGLARHLPPAGADPDRRHHRREDGRSRDPRVGDGQDAVARARGRARLDAQARDAAPAVPGRARHRGQRQGPGRLGRGDRHPGLHDVPLPRGGEVRRRGRRRHLRPVPHRGAGHAPRPAARRAVGDDALRRDIVNDQLERGDLLLCASEKQRDFWLGQIASLRPDQPRDLRRGPGPAPAAGRRARSGCPRTRRCRPATRSAARSTASTTTTSSCCGAAGSTTGSTRRR